MGILTFLVFNSSPLEVQQVHIRQKHSENGTSNHLQLQNKRVFIKNGQICPTPPPPKHQIEPEELGRHTAWLSPHSITHHKWQAQIYSIAEILSLRGSLLRFKLNLNRTPH